MRSPAISRGPLKETVMKIASTLLVISAMASTPAFANLQLAQKSACLSCHAVDKKVLGPAFQDVAKKYAGQKDAVTAITASIKNGGSGKWGPIPMPASEGLSEADAKTLATWIAGGAK